MKHMAVNLKPLVGKRALVQFREDYLIAEPLPRYPDIDIVIHVPPTRAWPFLIEERGGEIVLVYESNDRARTLVLRVSPDLVAFVTVCDDLPVEAAAEPAPQAT
jgi:hypothetical protein